MNRRLGLVSAGFPNARRHALGGPRMGPVVRGGDPLPLTNSSRKLETGDPGVKNLSVIFLREEREERRKDRKDGMKGSLWNERR